MKTFGLTKRKLELLIESITYNQLHLQKKYEQETDEKVRRILEYKHGELAELSHILIKALDDYDKE